MTNTSSKHNQGALESELVSKGQRYYTPNYKPREMILDRGQGARLWDLGGKDYMDLGSGIAVCSLGHQDPDLKAALIEQADKLWHTSNVFFTEPPIKLAEALVEKIDFAERVYLCNSGAEANEAAIKLARKYAADQGRSPENREIVSFTGSFHGRTLATVTATAQPKYHEGFEPLPPGFNYCEHYNNEASLRACFADGTCCISEKTCAVIVEPVQGEGGVVPARPGFLKVLRDICDEVGALLIVDEIQCGMGRTGKLSAYSWDEIEPDVMTLAKALGGGLPIGAMVVGKKAAETFQFGSHGSTFGGNPVMAAVALAALNKIDDPGLMEAVEESATQLKFALAEVNEKHECFADIRGRGLMIGAELVPKYHGKAGEISEIAREHGVLVLVAGPNVVRFLPPLTITEQELAEGMSRFAAAADTYFSGGKNSSSGIMSRLKRLFSRG